MAELALEELMRRGDVAWSAAQHSLAVFFYRTALQEYPRDLVPGTRRVDEVEAKLRHFSLATTLAEKAHDSFHYYQDLPASLSCITQANNNVTLPELAPLAREVHEWLARFERMRLARAQRDWPGTIAGAKAVLEVYRENEEALRSRILAATGRDLEKHLAEVGVRVEQLGRVERSTYTDDDMLRTLATLARVVLLLNMLDDLLERGELSRFEERHLLEPERETLRGHVEHLGTLIFRRLEDIVLEELRQGLFDQAEARLFGGVTPQGQTKGIVALCKEAGVAHPLADDALYERISEDIADLVGAASFDDPAAAAPEEAELTPLQKAVARLQTVADAGGDSGALLAEALRQYVHLARDTFEQAKAQVEQKGYREKRWPLAVQLCDQLAGYFTASTALVDLKKTLLARQRKAEQIVAQIRLFEGKKKYPAAARLAGSRDAIECLPEVERKRLETTNEALARQRLQLFLVLAVVLAIPVGILIALYLPMPLLPQMFQ
jgi:hypothetical protein